MWFASTKLVFISIGVSRTEGQPSFGGLVLDKQHIALNKKKFPKI
jgi:hypothetical protein